MRSAFCSLSCCKTLSSRFSVGVRTAASFFLIPRSSGSPKNRGAKRHFRENPPDGHRSGRNIRASQSGFGSKRNFIGCRSDSGQMFRANAGLSKNPILTISIPPGKTRCSPGGEIVREFSFLPGQFPRHGHRLTSAGFPARVTISIITLSQPGRRKSVRLTA